MKKHSLSRGRFFLIFIILGLGYLITINYNTVRGIAPITFIFKAASGI